MDKYIYISEERDIDILNDYLSFAARSHEEFVKHLFNVFSRKGIKLNLKRIYRAKIYYEYFLSMEEFYANIFSHQKTKRGVRYLKTLFSYRNNDLNRFVEKTTFTRDYFETLIGQNIINKLSTKISNVQISTMITNIAVTCSEMKSEYLKARPIANKLKHCFLVRNQSPKISGYRGNELFVITKSRTGKPNFEINPLSLRKKDVLIEVNNVKKITVNMVNLINFYLYPYQEEKMIKITRRKFKRK